MRRHSDIILGIVVAVFAAHLTLILVSVVATIIAGFQGHDTSATRELFKEPLANLVATAMALWMAAKNQKDSQQ